MAEFVPVAESTFSQLQKASAVVVNETYSWISNAAFYADINTTFQPYYQNTVRRVAAWMDGYVPTFHRQENGIFSTRIGNTLVNSIGEAIFGRELMFRPETKQTKNGTPINESLQTITEWAKTSMFQQETKKAIKYALGLGTSALKLNKDEKSYWVESIRLDYCHFELNARGEPEQFTSLLKAYIDVGKEKDKNENFYLVEKRYYKYETVKKVVEGQEGLDVESYRKRTAKVIYQVHKYTGNVVSAKTYDMSLRETMTWESIPKKIRDSIKSDYSLIRVGVEQDLKMPSLGVYIVTADEGNITLPNMPFGTSILENIIGYLMGYDMAYSYFFRDMYQGKGFVMMPKYMQMGNKNQAAQPFTGLDQDIFMTYETTSQEKQQVEKVQFDLRSMEWKNIRDFLIENIAMTLQLSPRTVASFLSAGGLKTATQVNSDDSASVSFVETRRGVMEKPINKMLKDVCALLNLPDGVEIRFSKEGVSNTDQLIQRTGNLLQAGLIDTMSALREIMIDADENQIQERYNAIINERKQRMAEQLEMASGQQLM